MSEWVIKKTKWPYEKRDEKSDKINYSGKTEKSGKNYFNFSVFLSLTAT